MGSRPEYEEGLQIEELQHRLRQPLLYVTLTFEVWERDGPVGRKLTHTVDDLHLMVDRISGDRFCVRGEDMAGARGEGIRELVASHPEAIERIDIVHPLHPKQLALVRDEDHRVIGAFGGQRGGKTHCLALWMLRQWMIKGGQGVRAWWVAPSRGQTSIGVDKLFKGEDEVPPIFDPRLVVSYPETPEKTNQTAVMVDGTALQFRHAARTMKGGQLKGQGPRWIGIDEACEITAVSNWRIIRGRVNKRGGHMGQIFMASTPMFPSWVYSEVWLRAEQDPTGTYVCGELSMEDNVWIPTAEVEEAIRDAGGREDPVCQREVFGRWVSAEARLWHAFDERVHIQQATRPEEIGLQPVSEKVAMEYWSGLEFDASRGLGGQDFNLWPMTTVVCQICVPKGEPDTITNRVAFFTDEFVTRNQGTERHGDALSARYPNLPIACDPSGAQLGHRLSMQADQSSTEAEDLRAAGHAVIPCHLGKDGVPLNPPQIPSIRVGHYLMHRGRFFVSVRCKALIESLSTQQATDRGTVKKVAGTASDRLSSATDAMRYLLWLVFSHEVLDRDHTRAA